MRQLFAVLLLLVMMLPARAEDPIRIAVLHSLSGTMGQSETPLKNVVLMGVEEINASGGVLGRQVAVEVLDPASDWDRYAELADSALASGEIRYIFGCWTSVSRKAVLPALERHGGLLFYPVQYEGEEQHPQVFYTGAAPNQQAIPAVEFLLRPTGGGYTRFVLIGTDYVYPRTTNAILRNFLLSRGILERDILELYTPFGHEDFSDELARVREFAAQGGPVALVSTINGDANTAFYGGLRDAGMDSARFPVMAFSVGENELQALEPAAVAGQLASWNYFMSLEGEGNRSFVQNYRRWVASNAAEADPSTVMVNDPMEATYIALQMWRQAVEASGSLDVEAVKASLPGQRFMAPSGYEVRVDDRNQHLYKPVFIGRANAEGQFDILWRSTSPLKAAAFSRYRGQDGGG